MVLASCGIKRDVEKAFFESTNLKNQAGNPWLCVGVPGILP
jgi:hypothetical protein